MHTRSKPVAPLDKVTLKIQAVPRNSSEAPTSGPSDVSFICGISPSGLAPFEQMLCDRSVGEQFTLPIETGTESALFGHLNCMFSNTNGFSIPCDLHVSIASAKVAEGRDIVKAMAQLSGGCGGGCDCGCGC